MHKHKIHPYGWQKDKLDLRDKVMRYSTSTMEGLPSKIDLRQHCSPVENQATLGSCTANATMGALEYLEIKDGVAASSFVNYSRLFVYYNTRVAMGTVDKDSGGFIREAVKAVADFGTCDELKWEYDITKFTTKPSDECYIDAATHKIVEFQRLDTLPDMLKCLADGFPIIFGFTVYNEFEGPTVASTGVLNLPSPTEYAVGGHAVLAIGYDMEAKTVLVRNSWGHTWGQDGYFTMPFSYIGNPAFAADHWTIRR